MESSIRVPKGSDPNHTYWCAIGFNRGYLGMQHNDGTERRILFSIWDDQKGGKVDALQVGEGGKNEYFGGEGTGMHTMLHYNWKSEETVFFRLLADVNKAGNYSDYTAWYRSGDKGKWTLIAKYRAHNITRWLTNNYSFLENYKHADTKMIREGFYGNQTIVNTDGKRVKVHMGYQPQRISKGDVWEQRAVNGEDYFRMDGPKNKGLYPPTGFS
ncbi:hypothetical protein BC941DRAFT_456763 [Chlamydoabsidia padenii]|nr:hypothetical protein BC941DRAFT_456763 [Chlamydoabsidia padenii]